MHDFPFYQQQNLMDCGPTCIRIIAKYYGRHFSIAYLRKATHTSREGSSLLGISKGAEEIGFHTLAVKIGFDSLLNEAQLPLIAHWDQKHFVVVYKVTKTKIFVSDPGNGLITYSHAEFLTHWIGSGKNADTAQGIALLVEPTPAFYEASLIEGNDEHLDNKAFLWHYIKPHKKLMIQLVLSLFVGSILLLIFPFLTQNIVDTGIYKKDIKFIWLVLIAQLMLTLGQMALELMRSWILLYVSSRINISLISDYFIKLMKLPLRYFDTRLTGDLLQRIQDHQRIESLLTNTSINAVFSLFNLLLFSVVLAYYSVTLFAVFIIGSVLYLGWIFFFLKRRKILDYKHFQQAGETNTKVFELINGMQEIKLHNAEQHKRWGWERIQVKQYKINIKSLRLEQTQNIGSKIINEVKNIVVSVLAAKLVIDGQLTLGMMLSVAYITGQLNSPILQLVNVIKSIQDAKISLERLSEIYKKEEESSIPLISSGKSAGIASTVPIDHNIRLENVCFAYSELENDVLKNIDLVIPAGKVTAIVGSSGSGKTTLLKLLLRFYEPTKGRVTVGNLELGFIEMGEWRKACGVVMQEGFIFNDTIAGNIAIGEDYPDWQRLKKAANVANIKSFIDQLPLGFSTKIGMEGLGLSTGQKQRILIARAVYKNPDIVFLDEATSALDANNERQIMQNLREFYEGKTVIIIAHRLSTVKNADKIVVLEDGAIVEEGLHDELALNRSYYFNLVKNQLELGQ